MHFGSDNVVGASDPVMQAIIAANSGAMPSYGEDDIAARVTRKLCDIFEREVRVMLLASGTAANGLALACLTPPWGEVFCHAEAHVMTDECGGPEHWTGGAKLTPIAGVGGKIDPTELEAALAAPRRGVHSVKPAALSITNLTECGQRYSAEETRTLAALARTRGLKVHMDGARFTNALVGGTESAADLTWKAGVDVLCLGATKNGALAAEAVVFFDPALAETASHRRMRGGHLLSKGRLLSAQMEGWLADDHWLALARRANQAAARLAKGFAKVHGIRLAWPVEGNEVFIILPTWLEQDLLEAGFRFYRWKTSSIARKNAPRENEAVCRLVCSWQTEGADIDALIKVASDASAAGR